jgi:hypothetical protein
MRGVSNECVGLVKITTIIIIIIVYIHGGIYWTLVTLDVFFQTKERLKKIETADWAKI